VPSNRRKPKIEPSKLYTLNAAARLLGVSEETVKANLRKRKLSGEQIGPLRKWHVRGASIIARRHETNMDLLEPTK
jgi:hypothetical protein